MIVAGAVAAAVFASACSSGSGKSATSSAGTPARQTASPASAASPSPAALTTPVDPATVQLQLDPGAQDAYTIQIPVGWQAENIPSPGGFGRRYTFFDSGTGARRAQVTVRCQTGATVDSLSLADSRVVGSLKGNYAIGGMIDVSVGGLPGKQTEYTLPVAGLIQETRVIYLKGAVCGWQILLQAYGSGQLAIYTPLFEAVVATFKPLAAG